MVAIHPDFRALHSQLRKGHTTKKDFLMFFTCIASLQKGIKKTSPYSFSYPVSQERMTLALHFMVIHERNWMVSTEMSFFVLCPHRCRGVALIIGI